MMMDGVSLRLRGDAAAHSLEAVRARNGPGQRPDRQLTGAGRGVEAPIG